MAVSVVSVVSPLLKRLTFVNWDKNGNPRTVYRRVPVGRVRLDERRLDQVQ